METDYVSEWMTDELQVLRDVAKRVRVQAMVQRAHVADRGRAVAVGARALSGGAPFCLTFWPDDGRVSLPRWRAARWPPRAASANR